MAGIIFFRTKNLDAIIQFYTERLGMTVWLEQKGCTILHHGNLLLGFCEKDVCETEGVITFFSETRNYVDMMYNVLQDTATTKPAENHTYRIYQFYATDPEGRTLEFQSFMHNVKSIKIEQFLQG
ncbi:MAG: VOC family protein [Candidatus Thorarchaeota archaeon]|jgi:catechol 2,3-dioxygenase-like lactoylglutathione lyase family enzyme